MVELIVILFLLLPVIIWWRIFSKAGWPGLLSLLMFVPFVNLLLMAVFALTDWPIERELRDLRRKIS